MDKLKRQLLYLSTGEFAALCTFGILYRSLGLGFSSLAAFSYLMFILLQGSIYWGYRYLLLLKQKSPSDKAAQLWLILRHVNTGLMVLIGIALPIISISTRDLLWSIAVFVFAILEYINYFWYRLSYGKSGFNVRKLLNTKRKKSSINKLIG